jgi:hypothetical protein
VWGSPSGRLGGEEGVPPLPAITQWCRMGSGDGTSFRRGGRQLQSRSLPSHAWEKGSVGGLSLPTLGTRTETLPKLRFLSQILLFE